MTHWVASSPRLVGAWRLLATTLAVWNDDRAPSRGAANAFYTLFSVAPLLQREY